MNYGVLVRARAQRELESVPYTDQDRIESAVRALAENPRPAGCKKLKNSGYWRIRVGVYRVIYEIADPERVVVILHVTHRREAYR